MLGVHKNYSNRYIGLSKDNSEEKKLYESKLLIIVVSVSDGFRLSHEINRFMA